MKRIGLLTGMLLMMALTFAQTKELKETLVESPRFNFETSLNYDSSKPAICNYMQQSLSDFNFYDEGLVIVLFTINIDGSVSDFIIENSASKNTDEAVLSSIKSTSGMWNPGLVNGNPVKMQRKIMVQFLDPENESLEQLAQDNINLAVRKYQNALLAKNNTNLSTEKATKRAERRLNTAINLLERANRYQPKEPAVSFWQACAYEKLGNDMMKSQKINEFINLVDNNYQAQMEKIKVDFK